MRATQCRSRRGGLESFQQARERPSIVLLPTTLSPRPNGRVVWTGPFARNWAPCDEPAACSRRSGANAGPRLTHSAAALRTASNRPSRSWSCVGFPGCGHLCRSRPSRASAEPQPLHPAKSCGTLVQCRLPGSCRMSRGMQAMVPESCNGRLGSQGVSACSSPEMSIKGLDFNCHFAKRLCYYEGLVDCRRLGYGGYGHGGIG